MIGFFLRLLGVKIEGAMKVAAVSLHLRNAGALGWVILFGLALGALAWWTYRFQAHDGTLPTGRRRMLTALRIAFFSLILLLLLRPVLTFTLEGGIRRMLLVLIDTSASMNIKDPRVEEADIKRAALAKGLLSFSRGLDQPAPQNPGTDVKNISRVDLLKNVLENKDLDLLAKLRKRCDLSLFGFGQTLGSLTGKKEEADNKARPGEQAKPDNDDNGQDADAWVRNLDAKSPATAIGDAVREVIGRKRGQPVAGIFLVTDGANNSGSQPLEAANFAAQEGVPLYIYGVGITSPRDIIVNNLFTQDVAFVKDEVSVTVRVRGQGLKGKSATLYLKLGDENVAEKEVQFTSDDEQTVSLNFTPQKKGEFELQAFIPPREDEAVKDNNSVSQQIRVIDGKIKVLFVEQSPRWEFRYIQSDLLRDRRVDFKCLLFEGNPSIVGEGSPYLAKFPETKEELLKYDLVILGDVDPKFFTKEQFDNLAGFISKFGGALVSISGKRFNPNTYQGTVIEKILPVELESAAATAQWTKQGQPSSFELTAAGATNPMLRLSPKEDENAAIWKAFPPVYWVNKVARAKPGAQVLLEDTDITKASRSGKMPVLAQQQFGLGQVLYIGTDNTWRWRKNGGENFYTQLWGQITQKMALTHLLGGSKRTQLTVDKQSYTTGERVNVYARLYDENLDPVREETVNGVYAIAGGAEKQDALLRAVPGQPGMYRGDFVAITPGTYQFSVKSDPRTVVEFSASEPKFELGETAMNEPLLKQMAAASGGAFFREENLPKAADTINQTVAASGGAEGGKNLSRNGGAAGQKGNLIRSTVDAELWSSPFYFLLMLGVVTVEWLLRKRSDLK